MNKIKIFLFNISVVISLTLIGCGEQFLDIKRNANQVVPHLVKDYLAIISRSNMLFTSNDFSFLGSDEYYISSQNELVAGAQYSPFHQYAYIWSDYIYGANEESRDWNEAYEKIMHANLALEVIKLKPKDIDKEDWVITQKAALFHRAWNYYQLAQLFCKVYNPETASEDLGLPLRIDYDVSVRYSRSTLEAVYNQIFSDLHRAKELKGPERGMYLPSDLAISGLLSRVYLQTGDYKNAFYYSNEVLNSKNTLFDYNALSGTISSVYSSYFPVYGKDNPEIIFYSSRSVGGIVGAVRCNADTLFLNSYHTDDLRRKVCFFKRPNGTHAFIGSYSGYGANSLFTGLTVSEMLLIRAECNARMSKISEVLIDINHLRRNRYQKSNFKEVKRSDFEDPLQMVLNERKKEMYMRGTRWEYVRRLNREGKYNVSFKRMINGVEYLLEPNSSKWVWPIPFNEIASNDLEQNER